MLKHTAQLFHSTLSQANRTLIAFPTAIDIDSVVSGITLGKILQKIDKPFEIISNDKINANIFKSLPLGEKLGTLSVEFNKSILPPQTTLSGHDLIITLNSPELSNLGNIFSRNEQLFYNSPIINIGYGDNSTPFGALNLVQPAATSSAEIIYDLFNELDSTWLDEQLATYLLAGMIYKTKKFKSSEISSKSVAAFRLLIESGARKDQIFKDMYRTKTPNILKLWSKIILKLQTNSTKQIAWATIQDADFEQAGTGPAELFNLTNELLSSLIGLRLVLFYYKENNEPTALIIANNEPALLRKIETKSAFRARDFVKITRPNMPELLSNLKQLLK